MMSALAEELGPCVFVTGMPHGPSDELVTITAGPGYRRGSMRQRVMSWVGFTAFAARHLLFLRGRPLVFLATNPPLLPSLAWMLRRLRGFRYVLLVWDIYPDHLVRANVMGAANPVVRGWRAAERRALEDAEAVITVGDGMASNLREKMTERGAGRVSVIHNWADTAEVRHQPKADNAWAQAHGQVGKITVQYSGNLGATHDVMGLVDAAALLTDDPRICLMVVGDGLGVDALREHVRRRQLPNVVLLPRQPWKDVPHLVATADIAVVSQRAGSENLSVPSKTYTALAAGSAILALTSTDSDLGSLVRDHAVGAVCPARTPHEIAAAVRSLVGDPAQFEAMRQRARQLAQTQFSPESVRRSFLAVLKPLVDRGER
jgi:glycosyltransferase involved in cell wall biosynthesis